MLRHHCRAATLGLALLAGVVVPQASVFAQAAAPLTVTGDSTVPRREPLFGKRDALIAGGFAVATVAMFPLDRRIAGRLQDPQTQENRFLRDAATGFELIASPGALVIGGSMYAVGRIGHFERVADLGLHGTEAVFVAQVVGNTLKYTLGRARPYVSGAQNPDDFRLGRGFSSGDYQSFPSGHTYTAFAAAASVTSETHRWWPRSTWVVAPVMYGGATMVGLSRMYHNKHWASDVALGAAVGTFSGLKTVKYAHSHPGNRLDRLLLGTTIAPGANGGAALVWTGRF